MPAFVLDQFKTAINDGPALNQYFKIEWGNQFGADDSKLLNYLVRSTEVPGYTMNTLPVPYRGLEVKIADRPTFSEWTCQFLCLSNATNMRSKVMQWMYDKEYDLEKAANKKLDYKQTGVTVSQLAYDGTTELTTIEFHGAFPTTVGNLSFDQSGGSLVTFDVTLTYDYFIKTK